MRVYLVDDSAVIRIRLGNLLAELPGAEVVGEATGAAEALAALTVLQPDVLILDLQLAQGSGFDVLEKVVCQQPAPWIVVLTNHAYPQYRQKCLQAGADYFFDKSTELDRVVEVIQQLVVGRVVKGLVREVSK